MQELNGYVAVDGDGMAKLLEVIVAWGKEHGIDESVPPWALVPILEHMTRILKGHIPKGGHVSGMTLPRNFAQASRGAN